MNVENPGVEMFKKQMYILEGGNSAAKMRKDVSAMVKVANKLLNGEPVGSADEEGYFARGIRRQTWLADGKPASERMVEMLVKKLNGEPFQTELPIPKIDRVPIAAAIKDLSKARIALVTTGGIVPVDNPDHIQSASATAGDVTIFPIQKRSKAENTRPSMQDLTRLRLMQIPMSLLRSTH